MDSPVCQSHWLPLFAVVEEYFSCVENCRAAAAKVSEFSRSSIEQSLKGESSMTNMLRIRCFDNDPLQLPAESACLAIIRQIFLIFAHVEE